jgi:hypothetical protein
VVSTQSTTRYGGGVFFFFFFFDRKSTEFGSVGGGGEGRYTKGGENTGGKMQTSEREDVGKTRHGGKKSRVKLREWES